MTSTIALLGKSGNGKTTLVRAFLKLIRNYFKDSTILLIDNDLTMELSDSFGIKTKNTIYGIKSGKHEYKTGIPDGMSKQEYIEWALEDILISIDENTDIIASWLTTPKACKCPDTKLIRDSINKLIDRYDFVIIDCEYDLKYLNSLTDYPIDEAIIVSDDNKNNIVLSAKIADSSSKYVPNGQLGIVLNKLKKENQNEALNLINNLELNLIGTIENYDELDYDKISQDIEIFYPRLNLTQNK